MAIFAHLPGAFRRHPESPAFGRHVERVEALRREREEKRTGGAERQQARATGKERRATQREFLEILTRTRKHARIEAARGHRATAVR